MSQVRGSDDSPESFAEHERAGWEARAADYHDHLGRITVELVDPLLDAAGVVAGSQVLDVACGPGYVAGKAVARGAEALGLDFSPAMLEKARRRFPEARFIRGDAQHLVVADAHFDAVVCMFGLAHFPDADAAIGETFRVLRRGGRSAFTVWARPEDNDFFRLVTSAVDAHGSSDVSMPPAPDMYRFVDVPECEAALGNAGFEDVSIRKLAPIWQAHSANEFVEMMERSTVRAAMLVELQAPKARERIKAAMIEAAEEFRVGDRYESCWAAVLVSALKTG
jgi:ubiquinone/menaquinone biosynthesis C-methylase UbiE